MFVTVINPCKKVHVFKYRDNNFNLDSWKLNEDVWETAWQQDRNQAELIVNVDSKNLEESKKHFRYFMENLKK